MLDLVPRYCETWGRQPVAWAMSRISCRISSGFRGRPRLRGRVRRPAFAQPTSEGPRVDDGDDVLDGRTKSHAQLEEPGPFRRGDVDPFGELIPQDPVLSLEVLDHLDEFFLRGPGDKQQEGMDEPLLVSMRNSLADMKVAYLWDPATPRIAWVSSLPYPTMRPACDPLRGLFLAPCSHFVANGADVGGQDGRWWNLPVA